MKKILFTCLLAVGIGANAQYNYTADPSTDEGFIFFNNGTGAPAPVAVTAACIGNGVSQIASNTATQVGVGIDLLNVPQTNNGQATTISVSYKKAATDTGAGTFYLVLFDTDPNDATASWNISTITSVAITATTPTTCQTLTGTIPAGVLKTDGSREYAYGYFFVRSGGTTTIITADYKIVQPVVSTVPACGSFTNPANGATLDGGGANNFTWASVPTATGYHLTVGTTAGGNDTFSADIVGGVLSQYIPLNPSTAYFAKLVPYNSNGDATGCTGITFSTNSNVSYCTATAAAFATGNEIINKVVFADITQTSPTAAGTAGYQNYTPVVGHVVKTKTYPLTVSITGLDPSDKMSAWIDYNHNNIFEASEKTAFATLTATSTANITIPSTALLGDTRMRINLNYSSDPQACGTQTYGQVQDYTINIVALALPNCTTITAPVNGATGITTPSATLTWASDTMATGYKVYVGTTSGGTDTVNGTVATTTTFALTGLAKNTTYYAKVVPTNSLGDATGCSEISFTTGATYTYCTATHNTVNSDRMSNVAIANINNPSTVTTVTGGYEDFSAVVGNVEANGTYPITVTLASGNANDRVGVWVDSNNNGTFESTEYTVLTTTGVASAAGNISIPSTAVIATTRMRIRLQRSATGPGAANGCGNLTGQGRTQDYTLNIVPAGTLAVSDVNKAGISVYPNPFTDVLKISDVKGVKSISVNDVSGREVKSLAPSAELNLSNLKTGLYIVNLKMEDGSVKSFKAIKK